MSNSAFALGLGAIEVQSAMNQPMSAEIALTSSQPGDLQDLEVTLASADAFKEAGIERSNLLLDFKFTVDETSGAPVIKVESTQPVAGPYLSFLLEVNWREGRLLREYTILLDSLAFTKPDRRERVSLGIDASNVEDIQVEIVGSEEEVSENAVMEGDGLLTSSALIDNTLSLIRSDDADERDLTESFARQVTVKKNDTLLKIARNYAVPGTSVEQLMMAILAANSSSFINNNVNLVKAGSTLQIPNAVDSREMTKAEAIAAFKEQNQLWQNYRDSLNTNSIASIAQNNKFNRDSGQQQTSETSGPLNTTQLAEGRDASGASSAAIASQKKEKQDTLSDKQLKIVADFESGSVADSTNTNESTNETLATRTSEINRRLQITREELTATRLREADLSEQISELQGTTSNLDTLISLQRSELARLEAQLAKTRLAAGQSTLDTSSAANNTDTVESDRSGESSTGNMRSPEENESFAQSSDAGRASVTDTTEESFIQNLVRLEGLKKIAISVIGVLAVLGILVVVHRRRKRHEAFSLREIDTTLLRETPALVPDTPELSDVEDSTRDAVEPVGMTNETMSAAKGRFENSINRAVDQLGNTISDMEHDGTTASTASSFDPLDKITKRNNRYGDQQDNILSMVDAYLRYGLHSQAEDLLVKGIERNPEHEEYLRKLLHIYHSQGNGDSFYNAANDFHQRFGGDSNPEWPAMVAMNTGLNGDKPLPSHANTTTASETSEKPPSLAIEGTMSTEELDTMLKVAKAYIDMGDSGAAVSALGVVVNGGGSQRQIKEVKELLLSIA